MSTQNWKSYVLEQFDKRDNSEGQNSIFFQSFAELNKRLIEAEKQLLLLQKTDTQTELHNSLRLNEKLSTENERLKEELSKKNDELSKLKKLNKSEEGTNFKLNSKVVDLNNELTSKNKSIEIINDEILSLTIQNNVLNENIEALRKENDELIKRWMSKVRQDAEKLNEANAFLESVQNLK